LPKVTRFGYAGAEFCQGASKMICPQCRSADCHRSHRGGLVDFLCTLAGARPWRCKTCNRRFHAWRVAASLSRYAHCPRCGNFDLKPISRERVEKGTLLAAKRLFRIPAYRCDPCRERFFSLRPFRRILPSMVSAGDRKVSVPVGTEN
jgi:hypothetical protein